MNDERDVLVVAVDGEATVTVGERTGTLAAGWAVVIPAGRRRQITAGPDGVRYLSVHRRRPPLGITPARRRDAPG